MKSIDQFKIFELFADTASELETEDKTISNDIEAYPYIALGMVIKGIENFYILDDMMRYQYKDKYENIRDKVQDNYFNRLYKYLERFDETNHNHVLDCLAHDQSSLDYALSYLLRFFEKIEEYEKCAKIFNIQKVFELR